MDRLYRRHADEVLRYAMLVLRSRTDAEDVTQIVFMRALRAIERGERVRTPRNWLIKIAHNECRRLLGNRKVHAELPEEIAVEPVEQGRAAELQKALAALPETQRRALCLRELEGRSYAEIATTLDLSVSAVETLIFRARRALREQIEGALGCEEFPALLEIPEARAKVRAHARICAECATLERQARGRKSALKRIASALGLPGGWGSWWGAKAAAVAVGVAGVAAVASGVPAVPHDPAPDPVIIPADSVRNLIRPAAAHRNLVRPTPTAASPARHRTRFQSFAPPTALKTRVRPVVAAAQVPDAAPASGADPAPAITPVGPTAPVTAPASASAPAPAPAPAPPAAPAASAPPVQAPALPALPVVPTTPTPPVAALPAPPVTVTPPPVSVPSVQTPLVPIATPKVSLP